MTEALPDLTRPLRQPSWRELRDFADRLQTRTTLTPLERVAQEVGETAYALLQAELMETTVVMPRRGVIGLPPRLYLLLLRRVYRQMRAAASTGRA